MESPRRKLINKHLIKLLSQYNPKSVLEVGAGKVGNCRHYFKNPQDIFYVTLDPDSSMKPDILSILENSPFKDSSFDLVVCLEVLEHVFDPGKVLSELNRIMAKKSTLILSVPFLAPVHMDQDHWRFTEKGLRILFQKYFKSFKITEVGDEETAFLQLFHAQYRKRALLPLKPLIFIILKLLKAFKIRNIKSTTGYLVIAEKGDGQD